MRCLKISPTGENRMLSYACHYYIFNTENSFASVGYAQTELLDVVIAKIFHRGVTREAVRKAVALTLESNTDRDTFYMQLLYVLINRLKTNDAKEIAAEECAVYKQSGVGMAFLADGHFKIPKGDYYWDLMGEHAVELYFHLKIEL
jgi:hypothetical protein